MYTYNIVLSYKQISLIRLQKCVDLESSVMHKMYGFLETSERPFLEIWTLAGWPIFCN